MPARVWIMKQPRDEWTVSLRAPTGAFQWHIRWAVTKGWNQCQFVQKCFCPMTSQSRIPSRSGHKEGRIKNTLERSSSHRQHLKTPRVYFTPYQIGEKILKGWVSPIISHVNITQVSRQDMMLRCLWVKVSFARMTRFQAEKHTSSIYLLLFVIVRKAQR